MSQTYSMQSDVAAYAGPTERATFMRRTYLHVAGAVFAFVMLEALIFSVLSQSQTDFIGGLFFRTPGMWLLVLVPFILVGYVADRWAHTSASPTMQYLGLGLYVVAEAVIFLPLLIAAYRLSGDMQIIAKAGILTLFAFGGLTVAALLTRKDFSFLGPILSVGGFLLLGLVLISSFMPHFVSLGLWFAFLAVALAAGSILYSTSNIMHHYSTNMHVAAALSLFAALAMMFWYVLQILMSLSSRD